MEGTRQIWHTLRAGAVVKQLDTAKEGLTGAQAQRRLAENGPNKLAEGKKKTLIGIFCSQFADFMIWVLIAAALISGFLDEWVDFGIIMIVVILNAVMGTVQESKAEAALEALKEMAAPYAKVIRDGVTAKVPASELVEGDIVALEAGDSVPADLFILECNSLKAEESALTGESVPVEKNAEMIVEADAPLGDRLNMLYMGTSITYGRGLGIVVETGMSTEMGKIAHQLANTTQEKTPLQQKLNKLSNILSFGVLGIAAVIFVAGWLSGNEILEMFLMAVALAVAAIPEGMVAVVTIVLAMGMQRMAKQGAIIRRLPAVETLGSTQVICSDKTGTLTLNRMTVMHTWTGDAPTEHLFETMLHCNDGQSDGGQKFIGDPTETALLDYLVRNQNCSREDVERRVRAGEIPFDSDRKLSSVVISRPEGGYRVLVKGAPDVLILRCRDQLAAGGIQGLDAAGIEKANEDMARQALRVLAFAYKDVSAVPDTTDVAAVESELTFCGLVGMIDPPRDEVRDAIATCRKAGIRPVMITGDHKITATAIAENLGILTDGLRVVTGPELEAMSDEELFAQVNDIAVYARVAPEHKSRIVAAWQKKGKVVSMTGDGVNDAPALKSADIGVGMGITGTDVSKGASDMVLTDDNFATIVLAVREGRRIFDNIHKAVRFLLSSNVGEVLTLCIATFAGWRILTPVHILWINLVTDSMPALALGVEPEEDGVMERAPRGKEKPFLTGREWMRIAYTGAFEAVLTIAAYFIGSKYLTDNPILGMTMAFLTLSMLQLFAALGFQSEHNSVFHLRAKEHIRLWQGLGVSALLQLVVVLVPPLRELFGLVAIPLLGWVNVGVLCILMLLFIELQKLIARKRGE